MSRHWSAGDTRVRLAGKELPLPPARKDSAFNFCVSFCKFLSLSEPLFTYGEFTTYFIELW